MTYSEAKAQLDEIAAKNTARANDIRVAKTGPTNIKAALDAMPAQYTQGIANINAEADANPTNAAWQAAKAEAALLAADFLALQATAGEMVTALAPIEA